MMAGGLRSHSVVVVVRVVVLKVTVMVVPVAVASVTGSRARAGGVWSDP